MTLKQWIQKKVLGLLKVSQNNQLPSEEERLTYINDKQAMARMRVREYNVWYAGDSEELLNFYTHGNTISYYYEPFYMRNKKGYFWAINSTESDIKRTHSGQPKNIVDILTAIMGLPEVVGGQKDLAESYNKVNKILQAIIEDNNFWDTYEQEQVPYTMVEGWGCWKIAWDTDVSQYPIPMYYRAENVDFIYKLNRITGVIFKDYYSDGKRRYLITETRYIAHGDLIIDKEIFEVLGAVDDEASLKKVDFKEIEAFSHIEKKLIVEGYTGLLAVPCIFLKDPTGDTPGRSLFAGKVDLFDDLDQALSQSANTVRKSTPVEYFDTDFLERDRQTGMPIQPKVYDRKYIMVKGATTADGTSMSREPVTVTQPNLDFSKYSTEAVQILLQIMNGIISPATLGMDIAKKDNAEAQREKEKVTVFTRNKLARAEKKILEKLFNELLIANELMHTGTITVFDYTISVNYPEFADESFENKITILGEMLVKGALSYKMYLTKLYGGSLSEEDYKQELEFLEEYHKGQEENPFGDEEMTDNESQLQEEAGANPFGM